MREDIWLGIRVTLFFFSVHCLIAIVFVCCALILSLILLLLLYTLFVRIMKALLGVCQQVDVISEPETVQ